MMVKMMAVVEMVMVELAAVVVVVMVMVWWLDFER